MQMKDEILTELWQVKDDIAKESNHNVRDLFERLRKVQTASKHPTVDRSSDRKDVHRV